MTNTASAEYTTTAYPMAGPIKIVRNKPVKIYYCNSYGGESERVINPISIYHRYGHTYIKAYCSLAEEVRTFRKDRIIAAEPPVRPSESKDAEQKSTIQPEPERYNRADDSAVETAAESASEAGPVGQKKEKRVSFGSVVGIMFLFGIGFLLFLGSDAGQNVLDFVESVATAKSYEASYSVLTSALSETTSSVPKAEKKSAETQPEPPNTVTTTEQYRGYRYYKTVKGGTVTYSFPDNNEFDPGPGRKQFAGRHDIHAAINAYCFRQATGITSVRLEQLFSAADSDRNGYISWNEVRRFQRILVMNYRYKNNDIALRPDQFLEENGGDCEDFALVTAGLLRFWNWQPFIGSFAPSEYGTGHAICMVYSDTVPADCGYYWLKGQATPQGLTLKDGYYIPVDYDYVGATSNAMGKEWMLRRMYVPEEIYGSRM